MSYSVYFFAMDAERVANQFQVAPKVLLDRVESKIREQNRFRDEDVQSTMARAAEICKGTLADGSDPEYFHALCWLAEVAGERVRIGSFLGIRSLQYLDDVGIWTLLRRSRPSFAVPVAGESPPQVGFIAVEDMKQFAIPGIGQLPPSASSEVNYARQEFREVLESLVEDKLDLLAVLI